MPTTIHDNAELWAAAAVSGALNETELRTWNDHVAACPGCKETYNEVLIMSKFIKETLHSECPDPGFERRIIAKFRQAHAQKGNRRREFLSPIPMLMGGVACAVLVAFVGTGLLIKPQKPVLAGSVSPAIELQALSPVIRQTIESNSKGRIVSHVKRAEDNGEVSYEVETTSKDGEEWDLTVAGDGTLQSIEMAPNELPAAVQTALNAQVGKGTLEGVEKLIDDGETTYQAGITAPNDDERDFTYTEDGTLLGEEVSLAELPAAVQTAINTQVGPGKLEGIDKTFDDGEVTYDATMTAPNGQERDFSISKEGNLLSREVSLGEIPAPVRQTISQTLGQGKVVEINQSFVVDDQAMPYEIDGEKDGKPFDFMINLTGHFLGMME